MEFKSIELKETSIDMSARTIEGYAATWDLDQANDIINKGAFTKTIAEGFPAGRVKMLWQHDKPLGMPSEMFEDERGLYVKGKISRTQLGDEALELMRDGVVDRMSIGFSIPQNKSGFNEEGIRIISEVKLFEFSPVTFPANEAAHIMAVKSLHEQLIIAKSKGINPADSKEFAHMLNELKALVNTEEPLKDTLIIDKPRYDDTLSVIKSLGAIARITNK
jgi:HK97 family phage prohead protease